MDNLAMDITATISRNLTAWMAANPNLDTLKKLAAKSGVGFGTVQRAKNGDGNTTIKNLAAIARAFGRRPEHLLIDPDDAAQDAPAPVTVMPQQPASPVLEAPLDAIVAAAEAMTKEGRYVLLGRAEELILRYPALKAKRPSSA